MLAKRNTLQWEGSVGLTFIIACLASLPTFRYGVPRGINAGRALSWLRKYHGLNHLKRMRAHKQANFARSAKYERINVDIQQWKCDLEQWIAHINQV